jgi:hypothetical protein
MSDLRQESMRSHLAMLLGPKAGGDVLWDAGGCRGGCFWRVSTGRAHTAALQFQIQLDGGDYIRKNISQYIYVKPLTFLSQ